MTTFETFSAAVNGVLSIKRENMQQQMETQDFGGKSNVVDAAALNLCALSASSPGSPASDFSEDQENSEHKTPAHGKPPTMDRRNARERNRVRFLNMTFDVLRQHLPQRLHGSGGSGSKAKSKKMSKVDTLRAAIDYINQLQETLEESDAVDAAFKDCDPDKPFDSQLLSPDGSLGSSGSPTTVSDEGIGSEEDDLLDVTNWFHC